MHQRNPVNKGKMWMSGEKVNNPRNITSKVCEIIFGFPFSGADEISVLLDVTLRRWATFCPLRMIPVRSVETFGHQSYSGAALH
jgi:hypothetical protein